MNRTHHNHIPRPTMVFKVGNQLTIELNLTLRIHRSLPMCATLLDSHYMLANRRLAVSVIFRKIAHHSITSSQKLDLICTYDRQQNLMLQKLGMIMKLRVLTMTQSQH